MNPNKHTPHNSRKMIIKNGYYQNIVPTDEWQNMAAAKCELTFDKAVMKFRSLQYCNNMGTHGKHFEELEKHFKILPSLPR